MPKILSQIKLFISYYISLVLHNGPSYLISQLEVCACVCVRVHMCHATKVLSKCPACNTISNNHA